MRNELKRPFRLPWSLKVGAIALVMGFAVWIGRPGGPLSQDHAPRVHLTGRSDASQVLEPSRFTDRTVQQAYAAAHRIPATLNQLYCWCHCKENLGHRALLECFETEHAAQCDICTGEALLADLLTRQGTTDVRKIQDAIDARFGPGRTRS